MGGAQACCWAIVSGIRLSLPERLRLRPGAKGPMGHPAPITFTLNRLWVWEWPRFSINFLISVIKVQQVWRFPAFKSQLMMPQGVWRPYEDQPASLQGWRYERCSHLPKRALGFNGVLSCWMLRSYPPPLCYPFLTRLPGGVGEKFWDRHHPGWYTHHTGWALQQCQGLRCFEPGALSATNGWKRDSIGLGVHLLRHIQVLKASFLECFLPDCIAELKYDHFYGGLPKRLKAMVAYLKVSTNEKMYSDYLQAVREAEKEEAMEPSCSQTADSTSKPKAVSFFPLWKLKGT